MKKKAYRLKIFKFKREILEKKDLPKAEGGYWRGCIYS